MSNFKRSYPYKSNSDSKTTSQIDAGAVYRDISTEY